MILSAHQPCYLPGIQLINKIMLSDAFMHVGHCQYQPKSWHSHNFIRTCELIVPVHKGASINETEIDYSGVDDTGLARWQRKHIRSIELAYEKSPFFDDSFSVIEGVITERWKSLGQLNMIMLEMILDLLEIDEPEIYCSEDYNIEGAKTDMLISMCKAVGADEYLSNEGAGKDGWNQGYIGPEEEQRMADAGIRHRWQSFTHPLYGQDGKQNLGRLSVIDPLFRLGAERTRELCQNSGKIA